MRGLCRRTRCGVVWRLAGRMGVSPLIRPLRGHLLPQGEKEAGDLLLQQRCQFGLHEPVVVGDVEADDALALQVGLEAALEFGAVGALHDEDEVGLVEVVGRDRLLRIGRQAGGGGLDAGARGEDALGRGRAEAVAGAEEEEVGQSRPS